MSSSSSSSSSKSSKKSSKVSVPPSYTCKFVLRGHRKAISSVKFSPDGEWLASAAADGTVRLWNVETGVFDKALEEHEEGISDAAWSNNSKYLATASDDKTIKLWERETVRWPFWLVASAPAGLPGLLSRQRTWQKRQQGDRRA